MPEWEDDELVENLFVFLASGTCSSRRWREVISMVFQIYDHNDRHGIGSRIKAYTVAGLIPDEIADKFSLDVDAVLGYLEIFFDVHSSLSSRDKLSTLVAQFAQDLDKSGSLGARREASWVSAAFLGGVSLLDICTCIKSDQDEEQFEETARFIFSQMGAKAAEAAAHLRMGDSVPKKSHLEFFLEMNDVQSRVISANAQRMSVEEDRQKDDGHKRMQDFLDAVATKPQEEDFLGGKNTTQKDGGPSISLDSLKTEAGRKRIEDLLDLEAPGNEGKKKGNSGPSLRDGIRRAS